MQNHHSLLYREEEREMLPLLKVSTPTSNHMELTDMRLGSQAPRSRMHPLESIGERVAYSAMGR